MKYTAERIRIIKVFKKYSRLGLASGKLDALEVYGRIIGCSRGKKEARELLAVYDTVRFLGIIGKKDCLDALRKIYFFQPYVSIGRNGINERVGRYACENYCDARTVYRRLSYAVSVYKKFLGESFSGSL